MNASELFNQAGPFGVASGGFLMLFSSEAESGGHVDAVKNCLGGS
jgi:hypothetical protein